MADQLQLRGGTTTEHGSFTGALREVTVDIDKDVLVVHDGVTAGGHPVAAEDLSNVSGTDAASKLNNQTVAFNTGAAATPSVTFNGDTNTGIYSPGADQLALATNGTGRLFVDSSGNVGVGGSPDQKLTVVGNIKGVNGSGQGIQFVNTTTPYIQALGTSNINDLQISAQTIQLQTGTTYSTSERLRITSDGKVGVGTSSPGRTLDVTGTARVSSVLTMGSYIQGTTQLDLYGDSSSSSGVRLDSSGRVGIGSTTPSDRVSIAGDSATEFRALTLRNANGTTGCSAVLTFEASTGTEGGTTAIAAQIRGVREGSGTSGALQFNTSSGGVPSQRARIDSSGRLLVGTSSVTGIPATLNVIGGNNTVLHTQGANADSPFLFLSHARGTGSQTVNAQDGVGAIAFVGYDGTNALTAARIEGFVDGTPGANDMPGRLVFSTTADGAFSPTERMRITSDGEVWINRTTSDGSGASLQVSGDSSNPAASFRVAVNGNNVVEFLNSGETVTGSISINAAGTVTAYNTSSDYRLKENVVPLTGAVDRLNQLKVHRFNFIADPDKTVDGFIAHEAQTVVPECVAGTKDEVDDEGNPVYQGIDQSKIVPLLTAALQEALAKIEVLEQRLTDAGIA